MASFLIVEHLDVIEQVGARLVPGSIADAIDAFAFEQAKAGFEFRISPDSWFSSRSEIRCGP